MPLFANMDLSIVIVTHNSISPVEECLGSLERHPPSCTFETIVIDNASSDGTPSMITEKYGYVRLAVNDENTGYSRGVNQGIAMSTGRMILILNPDIILRDGSIDRLMEFMEKTPDAGIAGAKLLYPDGTLQYSCRAFYTLGALFLRRTPLGRLFPRARPLRRHLMTDYDHETARKVDWVLGACMLVRREAVEKVGRMDERFFLYLEDTDWCYRMKNRGWPVYYVPESVMIHSYERSSARSMLRKPFVIHMLSLFRYYEKWNRIFYFLRRHRGALKSIVFVLSDVIAINLSFVAAYYLRDFLQPLFTKDLYPIGWYRYIILFSNLIFMFTFLFSGLCRIRRETPWIEELLRVIRALLLGLVILLASTYLTRIGLYSRAVLVGQAMVAALVITCFRRVIRCIHRELVRASFDLKRVLLLGSEHEAGELSRCLLAFPELGFDIVGYLGEGADSLGTVNELTEIVNRFKVQEVIVLPSYEGEGSILPFLLHSRGRMIQVRVVSPLARFLGKGVRVEELAGIQMFSIERGALFLARRAFKRTGDILASLVLLPFVSFFSALYYTYGKFTGRVRFFSEVRRGAGAREIRWPRVVGVSGREAGDIFKVELCLHVLLGRLSLVGPLPALLSWSTDELAGDLCDFKPGVTGRWRVMSYGGWPAAMEDGVLELQSWSLTREIVILAQSLKAMLFGIYPKWYFENRRDS